MNPNSDSSEWISRHQPIQACILSIGSIVFGLMMCMLFLVPTYCDTNWAGHSFIGPVLDGVQDMKDNTGAWLVIAAGAIRFVGGFIGSSFAPSLARIKNQPRFGLTILGLISAIGFGGLLFVYMFIHDPTVAARNNMLLLITAMMFVIGLASGGFSVFVPLMLVDMAPMARCGAYGTVFQVGASLGSWLPDFVCAVKERGIGDLTISAFIGLALSVAVFLLSPLLPKNKNPPPPQAGPNLKGHWGQVLRQCLLAVFNQMSGINYWLSSRTRVGDFTMKVKWLPLAIIGLPLCPVVLMFVIDRTKRRVFWQLSSCGVLFGLVLLILGCFKPSKAVLYSSTVFYCAAFGIGMSSLLWSNAAEMFQDRHLRWIGMRLVSIAHWFTGFCVLLAVPIVGMSSADRLHGSTGYIVCAAFTLASAVLSRWTVGDPWYDAVREIPVDPTMPLPLPGIMDPAGESDSSAFLPIGRPLLR